MGCVCVFGMEFVPAFREISRTNRYEYFSFLYIKDLITLYHSRVSFSVNTTSMDGVFVFLSQKINMRSPNPQWEGIRTWGLWEVRG